MKNKLSTLVYFIIVSIVGNYTLIEVLDVLPLHEWETLSYVCWGAILYHLLIAKED